MRHNQRNTKEFLVGAAVGSLLGGVAALLAAPKSGKKLRRDLNGLYEDLSETTEECVNKGKSIANAVNNQSSEWASMAKSAFQGARNTLNGMCAQEEHGERGTGSDYLIGGLVGGILGAVAGLLLAPKAGEELREDMIETYQDLNGKTQKYARGLNRKGKAFVKTARSRTNKWLDVAKHIVEDLTEDVQSTKEDWVEKAKGLVDDRRIHDVMDWASLGFRLWQGVNKAKR